MNQQRPLVPDGSIPLVNSARAENELRLGLPAPPLTQRKKKPGPKRDSRPAPSEKLERNRQAQRTHRERKEQYTKDLELEVSRLKELYVTASKERDAAHRARDEAVTEASHLRDLNRQLQEENQRMREIVQSSSSFSGTDSGIDAMSASASITRNSSYDSFRGMFAPASFDRPKAKPEIRPESVWEVSESRGFAVDQAIQENPSIKIENGEESSSIAVIPPPDKPVVGIDYDELGLDFVLTLERPCMGHMQFLTVRAHNYQPSADGEMAGQPLEVPDDGENQHISGHALMASAPSYSQILHDPTTRQQEPQFPTDLKREDLLRLLDLSSQLAVDEQELPPVKAWLRIMQDGRSGLFSSEDLQLLKQKLLEKVHCYRFGAVIDEHDIDVAISDVLESKSSSTAPAAAPPCIALDREMPL